LGSALYTFYTTNKQGLLPWQSKKPTLPLAWLKLLIVSLTKVSLLMPGLRRSLVGIELLAIEARVVIASVETYLKYAEAVGLTQSAAVPA
jgi:hypothetical protein